MTSPLLETYKRAPLAFVEGKGTWLRTDQGEWYLDLSSGIAVNSLGHANEKMIEALERQARLVWHTSNLYAIPAQENLAQMLVKNTFADKVFFTNSGTESTECAIKMARKYHFERGASRQKKIITFEGSFHGRSMAAISASRSKKLTNGFAPLLPGFQTVPFGDLDSIISEDLKEVCAILIEPIQGEGGIVPCQKEFLVKLKEICDSNQILLIFDEIQSGIGRSGDFFAFEHSGVIPDIVTVAKGIGGGFPLGCCLASSKVASAMGSGTHGSTFGGNPLACAVGAAVLEEIFSEGFLQEVKKKGKKFREELEDLTIENPDIFQSVRGRGLMLGLKCTLENSRIIEEAYKNRLLIVPAADNVVRILPPLNIEYEEILIAIERFKALIQNLKEKL